MVESSTKKAGDALNSKRSSSLLTYASSLIQRDMKMGSITISEEEIKQFEVKASDSQKMHGEECPTQPAPVQKDNCLRIPSSLYQPVQCKSKAGLASKALFESHLPKEAVPDAVTILAPKRPSEAKTLQEFARVTANLSKEQKAKLENSSDAQKGRGAVSWTRTGGEGSSIYKEYYTPRTNEDSHRISPTHAAPPKGSSKASAVTTKEAPTATRVVYEEATTPRARPQSASSSFRAVTRDRAQRTSIRTGAYGSGPEMAPGKYNPSLTCSTKHSPSPFIRPPSAAPASTRHPTGSITQDEAEEESQVTIRPLRPASALPSYLGLSSFRSSKRLSMESQSAASHLATAYYSEGYDKALSNNKAVKLITSFTTQVKHPPLMANSDSPAALGPGAYGTPSLIKDLNAGHKAENRGLSFSRQVTRPGSAPPASVEVHRNGARVEGKRDVRKSIEEEIYGPGLRGLREGLMGDDGVGVIYEDEGEGRDDEEEQWASTRQPPTRNEDKKSAPLGLEQIQRYTSYGLAKVTGGGKFPRTSRSVETQGLRAMSRNGIIPPASGPLRLGAGADVFYEPRDEVQGHRKRASSARMPPNRHAGTTGWITSAALQYL